ncbi:MAG: UDP-N-acetylglucosamine--N-acetylmuramyl-(pentapeptide) pyrophosphoryl-undecaprenol N-acetylglucosamine transferase [uncultured Segetibacter sp.]|uniref:UDP-N-acetylglucosamine--N-acetylmuramyl-(Pentape ptide) pyrophosphoryl-undecaprenol N-acetylglucosamine transferase n=1 Tax=uncultured Segetibacter sp. TaxID=481133 RepID=A0A6J4U713_9BACT|nr:MAG: UDP-N-acetylglucosamine--N-acetylmuramyl-(pentapeptide) pyrophosphoryl-undecaprenol N-acetylglucosamine transferase [uncultured Segetibacter sp.]
MLLGKNATKIFVASDGMEKFFPKEKIQVTGNPVRKSIANSAVARSQALRFFNLDETKITVLAVGGSLGARSINEALSNSLDAFRSHDLQLIWQTGKTTAAEYKEKGRNYLNVWADEFITQMEMAYAAADIVISRSGAMAVTELCVAKKPVIFVPFPFAAEDHQTVNAQTLVDKKAALIIKDSEANEKLAVSNADEVIAREILKPLPDPKGRREKKP